MCQPWLTTTDWPVNAAEGNAASVTASSLMSSTVVNYPSTVCPFNTPAPADSQPTVDYRVAR